MFGKTLFNGSPFIFWALSPPLLIFAISLPLLIGEQTASGWLLASVCSLASLMLIFVLYDSERFHWIGRALAGMVFLAYISYLGFELLTEEKLLRFPPSDGETHPIDAFFGLIFIGLPSLWFTLFGRFTFREDPRDDCDELEAVEFTEDE